MTPMGSKFCAESLRRPWTLHLPGLRDEVARELPTYNTYNRYSVGRSRTTITAALTVDGIYGENPTCNKSPIDFVDEVVIP